MTYEEIKNNEVIKTYIKQANESLDALGTCKDRGVSP